jgi:hypothetical protein
MNLLENSDSLKLRACRYLGVAFSATLTKGSGVELELAATAAAAEAGAVKLEAAGVDGKHHALAPGVALRFAEDEQIEIRAAQSSTQ